MNLRKETTIVLKCQWNLSFRVKKWNDEKAKMKFKGEIACLSYVMSPYPTVVIVTTAHQNASGMDLKKLFSLPASAKYTAEENSTTP